MFYAVAFLFLYYFCSAFYQQHAMKKRGKRFSLSNRGFCFKNRTLNKQELKLRKNMILNVSSQTVCLTSKHVTPFITSPCLSSCANRFYNKISHRQVLSRDNTCLLFIFANILITI